MAGTLTTKDAIIGIVICGILITGGCLIHDYINSFNGTVMASIGVGFYIASLLWFWVDQRRNPTISGAKEVPDAEYDQWMRDRYPSGMPVFYDIDELLQAIESKYVTGAVGIPYHVITGGPASAGMKSEDSPRWNNELKLQRASYRLGPLGGEVIVLIAIGSWKERCQ